MCRGGKCFFFISFEDFSFAVVFEERYTRSTCPLVQCSGVLCLPFG